MIELKMRAWDVENKVMLSPRYLYEKGFYWIPDGRGFLEIKTGEIFGTDLKNGWINHMIPLLYTDRKSLDKEIYEGDILINRDWGQKERYWGVVVYQVTEFVVRYHGLKNKTWQELTCLADGNCDHWTITGNIYENPELLKQ